MRTEVFNRWVKIAATVTFGVMGVLAWREWRERSPCEHISATELQHRHPELAQLHTVHQLQLLEQGIHDENQIRTDTTTRISPSEAMGRSIARSIGGIALRLAQDEQWSARCRALYPKVYDSSDGAPAPAYPASPSTATPTTPPNPTASKTPWPAKAKEAFQARCVTYASARKLQAQQAEKFCSCASSTLEEEFSSNEFQLMLSADPNVTHSNADRRLRGALSFCQGFLRK